MIEIRNAPLIMYLRMWSRGSAPERWQYFVLSQKDVETNIEKIKSILSIWRKILLVRVLKNNKNGSKTMGSFTLKMKVDEMAHKCRYTVKLRDDWSTPAQPKIAFLRLTFPNVIFGACLTYFFGTGHCNVLTYILF